MCDDGDGIWYRYPYGADGKLYYSPVSSVKRVVLMNDNERRRAMHEAHDVSGAHQGQKRTLARLTQDCYWYTMTEDVKKWVCICYN